MQRKAVRDGKLLLPKTQDSLLKLIGVRKDSQILSRSSVERIHKPVLIENAMHLKGFILSSDRVDSIRKVNEVDTIARHPFKRRKSIQDLELNL